jgi:8-oxo-dGTP pyrophosphatase MutT (NUDIX family)
MESPVSHHVTRGPGHLVSDPVETVRSVVASHEPADDREVESRDRILEELDRLADPFDEDADPVHVTGSAVVVGTSGTILHLHKRLGRWMQTGGHLEPGELPHDAALRESEEETGLDLSHPRSGPRLLHVDVHLAANGHTHLDLRYLLLGPDEEPSPPAGESPLAKWFSWDEALERSDDALKGALLTALRQPETASLSAAGRSED